LNLLYCAEAGRGLRARFLLHVRCDFIKPVDQPLSSGGDLFCFPMKQITITLNFGI
jgi:hypothetical protein